MNNKGFTLIELLATIVIIAIVGGIATTGVTSIINTSKLKSEKVFVDKLANLIEDYLDLNAPTVKTGDEITFIKCIDDNCNDNYQVTATKMLKSDNTKIYLNDLVINNIIESDELVNPKNKEQCLSGNGPEIKVYKDSEFVYYYYVDLSNSNTTCDISLENAIINTLPENLRSEVGLS